MQVRTVRKPGERGTQKLVEKYGERLVCVRYRYKTVELIIAAEPWVPTSEATRIDKVPPINERHHTPRVPVRFNYYEKDLQRQIKAIGGTWEPTKKLWYAPEEYVRRIGLDKRIVR
jgi:hypothetical protein